MSADSLRKQSKQGNHGQVILPQAINDPSIIESVAGFIHEVVPQAYSSVLPGESRDSILWARFDSTDYNDPANYPQISDCEGESTTPLVLVLGYSSGVQVWSIGGSGEATELLSWCQGAVRAFRILLTPPPRDPHSSKRPLVAIVDSSSPGPQFSTLSFISLKTAEVVKIIKFNSPISDVHCNRKSIVVTFNERIAVFDSATLEDRLTITTCYLSPGNSPNPIALGTRWLAYGEKRLTTWQRSSGGCEGDGAKSYTSTVIHAAKSLSKGLRELGGSLTGSAPQTTQNQAQPGIVSVVDIERKGGNSEEERGNMIAHFVAHTSAVVAMAFDPAGLLLVTADRHGHSFNVFRIHPHPCTSQLSAVHHLYILHRGETTARVQDIAVSWDSRWVAISSVRGTTHVFPITPYGGPVTVRTHTSPQVVNRLSRFERSAGLRDGRSSPLPCEVPPTPSSPRLPPYPHPSTISPLAQLRARPEDSPLAATFGPPRAWLPGKPKSKRTCADSLYIISNSGVLVQYDLDPKCVQGVAKEKVSYDTGIVVDVEAKAEWVLPKPPYSSSLCPPLPPGHVLIDQPPKPQPPPDKWLSQVEIVTHTGPHRRLWMGPQFSFKSIDPLPSSMSEEGGMESGKPMRSNPVNMPHRPYLLVETSSGGSVGSPQTDFNEAGGRLKEDLADAMLETHHGSGQARGKLRKAQLEWQVNPLGAVQTHPVAVVTQWPHPIFYEPLTVDIPKELPDISVQPQLLSSDKKISVSPSDVIVSPPCLESSDEKYLKNQTYSNVSLTHEHELVESPLGKQKEERKLEIDCSKSPRESLDVIKNISEPPMQKVESPSYMSRDQSEVSSSDKEVTSVEKNVPKLQEVEEKGSKSNRKARKKKNGKKDPSKSISVDGNNSGPLSTPLPSHKIEECKSECETVMRSVEVEDEINITTETSEEIITSHAVHETCSSFEQDKRRASPLAGSEDWIPVQEKDMGLVSDIDETTPTTQVPEHKIEDFESTINREEDDAGEKVVQSESPKDTDLNPYEVSDNFNEPIYNVEINVDESYDNDPFPLIITDSVKTDILVSSNDDDTTAIITVTEKNFEPLVGEGTNTSATENTVSLMESDLNGNQPVVVTSVEECVQEELLISFDSPEEINESSNEQISGESSCMNESTNVPLGDDSENFTAVSSKSSRSSRSKRKKKEKKSFESTQLADISEVDISLSSSTKLIEITDVIVQSDRDDADVGVEEPAPVKDLELTVSEEISSVTSVIEDSDEVKEKGVDFVSENISEEPIKIMSEIDVPLLFQEETHSDQVASTDRSEVEDISSHSGKESDDSKINKKERSRKQKRSESSDKDQSENKKKSPSPATGRTEAKGSESSDEFDQILEPKSLIQKVPKRKKGKKLDENLTEPSTSSKGKEESFETIKIDISSSSSKEKSSESSNENSSERIKRKPNSHRSWSSIVSNVDQRNSIDDRDSVYESCNDDGASDSLAFESSKEDFEENMLKGPVADMTTTSSNTEERTDSTDKNNQPLLKKVRKQKKKKR